MTSLQKVCVLGQGYVGLPTAAVLASVGHTVVGVDTNEKIINMLRMNTLHVEEPGLQQLVHQAVSAGHLTFSTFPHRADVFVIAVPTPVNPNRSADLQYVESATRSLIPVLEAGNLVILESTVPPRTVEKVMLPILQETGLAMGSELLVAYSPERVLPGRVLAELVENSRVVGGISEESTKRAQELYASFVKGEILCTNVTTAEMVKLVENTYRDINIAYANELAKICEKIGINVWEAIELANYHPRVNVHRPGPGVGGHCIAVDPWFIVDVAPELARLVRLGRLTNDSMPDYVVAKTSSMVSPRSKIAILGVAFKGNVDDVRESPAVEVIRRLRECSYELGLYDPYVKRFEGSNTTDLRKAVTDAKLILVLTDHSKFRELNVVEISKLVAVKRVFDTRNCLHRVSWEAEGFEYVLMGDGSCRQRAATFAAEAAASTEDRVLPE